MVRVAGQSQSIGTRLVTGCLDTMVYALSRHDQICTKFPTTLLTQPGAPLQQPAKASIILQEQGIWPKLLLRLRLIHEDELMV